MHGFISIISLNNKDIVTTPIKWKKLFSFQNEHIKRRIKDNDYLIEQYTAEKFLSEKIWIDNNDFICITDGIILNINLLHKKYNTENAEELLYKLSEKENFFKEWEGTFVGIFYDKRKKKWYTFNNQTGTQRLFYFFNQDYLVISTDLYTLNQTLKSLEVTTTLDEDAAYYLLANGNMIHNLTILKEVKQVIAGGYLEIDKNKVEVKEYFSLNDIPYNTDSKEKIIATLDKKFKEALKMEYEFCQYHPNYNHISTLSGGLDSRMTVLTSDALGFKNQHLFNFSHNGFADQTLAQKIADDYGLRLEKYSLKAESLMPIDDITAANDGLLNYVGCSHVFSILHQLSLTSPGCVHTGILGDAVMGSYMLHPMEDKPHAYKLSSLLPQKACEVTQKYLSKYPTQDLYMYYGLSFLGITYGFLFFNLVGEPFSPFLNTNFLSYAYSVPCKYKHNETMYIEWIKKFYPSYCKYAWTTIGGKPTNDKLLRFYYRYKRAVIKRLPIKTIWKDSMNPDEKWYEKNPHVKSCVDNYFYDNIERLNNYPELKTILSDMYKKGNFAERSNCITVLAAIKLHF